MLLIYAKPHMTPSPVVPQTGTKQPASSTPAGSLQSVSYAKLCLVGLGLVMFAALLVIILGIASSWRFWVSVAGRDVDVTVVDTT